MRTSVLMEGLVLVISIMLSKPGRSSKKGQHVVVSPNRTWFPLMEKVLSFEEVSSKNRPVPWEHTRVTLQELPRLPAKKWEHCSLGAWG